MTDPHIHDLVERFEKNVADQLADNDTHADFIERKKKRNAENKEIKDALMMVLSTDDTVDRIEVGNSVVVRTSKQKLLLNKERVKAHLGEEAFDNYARENLELDDRLQIKKKSKKRKSAHVSFGT